MDTNELIRQAQKLGFIYHGKTDGNHLLFLNHDGQRVITSSTPSDWRSHKNALARMERMSGQKLDRAKTGKTIHKEHKSKFIDTVVPDSQLNAAERLNTILKEYKALELEFRIIAMADADHTDINRAFKIVRRMAALEEVLTTLRQPLPEPNLKDLPTHIMTTQEAS